MRTISFKTLWLFWLGDVLYSYIASALGIFPSITLGSRLWDRFGEAWFICGAYFMCRVLEAAQARNAAGSPGNSK